MEIINGEIVKIEDIKLTNEEYNEKLVYDIEVEDNHNFFANNILVHNCHHLPSQTMNSVASWCKDAYYRIGVSATPWRDGGDDMLIEAVLKRKNDDNNINASKLIKLGYLVPCSIYFVPIKQIIKGKVFHKIYKEAIVDNTYRNNIIVKIAKQMFKQNKTILILIQRVEHGETLLKMLNKVFKESSNMINVTDSKNKNKLIRTKNIEFLSGKDDSIRRKAVIKATKEKKVKILIGSTIADEGLDISSLDCLILAGGGKSSTRAFQRIGRVLRLHTNEDGTKKERAICFDLQDYTPVLRRHARIRQKLYETEELWDIKMLNMDLLN